MTEYKLLRPLPNKLVGQKMRLDDINSILNMNTYSLSELLEGGWLEEWKEPKVQIYHIRTKKYKSGNSRITVSVESDELDNIKSFFEKIKGILV